MRLVSAVRVPEATELDEKKKSERASTHRIPSGAKSEEGARPQGCELNLNFTGLCRISPKGWNNFAICGGT